MTINIDKKGLDVFDFDPSEKIVSIVGHSGDIYIATTDRVLRRSLNGDWVEIFYIPRALQ